MTFRRILSVLLVVAIFGAAPFTWSAGLDTLNPGEWYAFPNSQLNKVDPCPQNNCSYSGVEGQAAVMDDWSGGAYDSKRDRLIVWGGGHGGYAGNEVYVFDIGTGAWSRVSEPSDINSNDPAPPNTTSYYHDGKPSARHTYNYLVYAPNVDLFFSMRGGGTYGPAGDFSQDIDSFNFTTKMWKSDWVQGPGGGQIATVAAYDPLSGSIWVHGTGQGMLAQFFPAASGGKGALTTYKQHIYLELDGTAAIDSKRHKMVLIGGYGGKRQMYVWDLNNPNNAPASPATSGDVNGMALESGSAIGFDYDPVSDRFVAWNGGTTVYVLNPNNWSWSRVNAAVTNTVDPGAPNARGTYGRFRYVPSKNAFVVVNRTDGLVYGYKLTAGVSPAPSVTLSASPTSVAYGESTTLSWVSSNAFACSPSGDWAGVKDVSGNEVIAELVKSSTFAMTCSGFGGDAQASTAVTVASADAGGMPGTGSGSSSGSKPAAKQTSSGAADGMTLLAALSYASYSRVRRRRIAVRV